MAKKKIKDLTLKECKKICFRYDWCDCDCPLFATHKCIEFEDKRYESEVEVDE